MKGFWQPQFEHGRADQTTGLWEAAFNCFHFPHKGKNSHGSLWKAAPATNARANEGGPADVDQKEEQVKQL